MFFCSLIVNISLQIHHINELNAAFIYRVIIIILKEIRYNVGTGKAAFFVEGDGKRTISCTYSYDGK